MLVLEGRAFFRGSVEPLAIGIADGRIAKVGKTLRGDEHHDYGDRLILPGGIDLHVHFRDPGAPHEEDFASGTAGAAVGGVTTVLDMPNTNPPVTGRDAYKEKLSTVRRKAIIDFGLYGSVRSAADVRAFAGLAAAGKMYMAHSAGRLEVTEPAAWADIVAAVAKTGLPLAVHAEHPALLGTAAARDLREHDRLRPPEAEAAAIRALGDAADSLDRRPRLHLAHLSSRAGLAAKEGTRFTAEVTPHHLFLDSTMPLKAFGKTNPPLRAPDERVALWDALVAGRIEVVASDHAPHTVEAKGEPFQEAPPGVPGVETMLPLLLRAVKSGDLSIDRFVDITARRPAEIVGLDAGILDVDRPANLLVVDPREIVPIRAKELHSRCGWTPFEGREAVFPQATYLRGELVAERREVASEGLGKPMSTPKRS